MDQFIRSQMLLGQPAMEILQNSTVAVFGLGGVGSYVAEGLARSGIGHFWLIDHDEVSRSNINRQLVADFTTVGRKKVEVMKERILRVNPQVKVDCFPCFYTQENADAFDFSQVSYVVDAIDTVTSKLLLAQKAQEAGTPIISCMGTGNKLDPTAFCVTDIYKTTMCPLARVMRRELKKRGISKLKVVYSTEEVRKPAQMEGQEKGGRPAPASVSFVPSVAGLITAGEVVKDLTGVR